VRVIRLSAAEADYLRSADWLDPDLFQTLRDQIDLSPRSISLDDGTAERCRDGFTLRLAQVGFEQNYDPNVEGDLLGRHDRPVLRLTSGDPSPATLLSLVNPSLGVRELKTADRTLMSHSSRGQALIESRVFEIVARAEGRRIAGKSAPEDDRTGNSQTHSPGT
jgi:hypothetical protein